MTGDGRKEADMIRTVWGRLRASLTNTIDDDRGDVPGWADVSNTYNDDAPNCASCLHRLEAVEVRGRAVWKCPHCGTVALSA